MFVYFGATDVEISLRQEKLKILMTSSICNQKRHKFCYIFPLDSAVINLSFFRLKICRKVEN